MLRAPAYLRPEFIALEPTMLVIPLGMGILLCVSVQASCVPGSYIQISLAMLF